MNDILFLFLSVLCGAMLTALAGMIAWAVRRADDMRDFRTNVEKGHIDDFCQPRVYITGDKHRNFAGVEAFCRGKKTKRQDILIILGDSGFNYYGDKRDDKLKGYASKLPITLFCIHGNKENRPQNIGTYGVRSFCGGKVYYEPKYPNLLFAVDGEIYTFEGKQYIAIGGAHSVDRLKCLEENKPFWDDEMPDEAVKEKVEEKLRKNEDQIYGVLSHTCPIRYLPVEMFLSTRRVADQKRRLTKKRKNEYPPDIDRSTEEWLEKLEKTINYTVWFCGHYHADKPIDKVRMLFRVIRPLHPKQEYETWDC